mgnify:FL=1
MPFGHLRCLPEHSKKYFLQVFSEEILYFYKRTPQKNLKNKLAKNLAFHIDMKYNIC